MVGLHMLLRLRHQFVSKKASRYWKLSAEKRNSAVT